MIVIMQEGSTREQADGVIAQIAAMKLKSVPIYGEELTVIAVVGDTHQASTEPLEALPGVDRVVRVSKPYKLASREHRQATSKVSVQGLVVGNTQVAVIAGPCGVESRDQLLETARAVKAAGATGLRGGAFKPRTSPYAFQGMGEEGLKLLAEARDATGLAIVTEVVAPEDVPLVAEYADVLQIGTRNMQNYRLLSETGKSGKAVLLKRGMAASLDELLHAAEYILQEGNPNVMVCERGIRTFETFTRNTLSIAAIPALKEMTHLPVIADPSHAAGIAGLVPALAKAAVAAGADGLIIEVHPHPEKALSDGPQSLSCDQFARLMPELQRVAAAVERTV